MKQLTSHISSLFEKFRSRMILAGFGGQMLALPLIFCAVLFMGGVLTLTGCGKKSTPPVATPPVLEIPPGAPAPPPSTASAPAAAANNLSQSDGQVDMPELQRTVIRWVVSNRRRPASFEDFAATAGVSIPPPPAGKKYIITHDLHVQLVNK